MKKTLEYVQNCLISDLLFKILPFSEAISANRSYPVPTKTEYASHMKEALRVAKQRNRNQLLSKKRRTTDDEEDF